VQLLKADHRQVRKLFEQCGAAPADEKNAAAARLFVALKIHGTVEEELIYPAVRAAMETDRFGIPPARGAHDPGDDGDELEAYPLDGAELDLDEEEEESEELLSAAYESHQIIEDLIRHLQSVDHGSDDYRELFVELEEFVTEHVAEEESDLFPLLADRVDLQALGAEVQRRMNELASQSPLAA
jgi:hemerythrin superfamily protein